ncbi:MAG: hypothetical protein KGL39_34355 [Patescibacteria group bacterium]|nr:hypothetical protein [Patescibacteria group bacterium]
MGLLNLVTAKSVAGKTFCRRHSDWECPCTQPRVPATGKMEVLDEAIIAYRGWDIREDGVLAPVTRNMPWPARMATQARCDVIGTNRGHTAGPAPGCYCGYYAFKTEDALEQVIGTKVIGRVKIWGRVIPHDLGYRAEYAYPQLLFTHPRSDNELIKAVADRYAIETAPMPDALAARLEGACRLRDEQNAIAQWHHLIQRAEVRNKIFKDGVLDLPAYAEHIREEREKYEAARHQYVSTAGYYTSTIRMLPEWTDDQSLTRSVAICRG